MLIGIILCENTIFVICDSFMECFFICQGHETAKEKGENITLTISFIVLVGGMNKC